MKTFVSLAPAAILLAAAGGALAQPIVDGTIAGDGYGAARAVQTVETGFGDNLSEWDAAYGVISGGRLYMSLTGNLESNFNKLEIFIDSRSGGQNTLTGSPGNDGAGAMAGLTFDSGFDADYHLIVRRGFAPGGTFDLDFADLQAGSVSGYFNLFSGSAEGAAMTGAGVNASPMAVAYNNSNVAGIGGNTGAAADQAAALAVMTGFEISIDLADLGYTGGDIRVLAFQNNQDHNYASNQFLGGLPVGSGNLGGDGTGTFTGAFNVNLNDFAGEQFFTIPAPGAAALLGFAGLAALRRRR